MYTQLLFLTRTRLIALGQKATNQDAGNHNAQNHPLDSIKHRAQEIANGADQCGPQNSRHNIQDRKTPKRDAISPQNKWTDDANAINKAEA